MKNETFSPSTMQSSITKKIKQDILDITGKDGPWQRRIFIVFFLLGIVGGIQHLSMSFLAPRQDYWCARPPGVVNLSIEEWREFGLPKNDQQCSRYENISLTYPLKEHVNGTVVPCDTWEYDTSFYSSTVLSEWNLVCGRNWLVSMSKSLFMVGILVSSVLFGNLSDRVGRRPTTAAACFLFVFSSGICAFSISFPMFIAARFFTAIGAGGFYNTLFVLLMEVVGPEMRNIYGNAVQLGWSVGFVSLPGIVWLTRDRFWIQISIAIPSLIFLAVWWIIPESPRWLLSKGRLEEAEELLIKAAKTNGKMLSDIEIPLKKVLAEANQDLDSGGREGRFLDMLRTPGLWQITLNIYYSWFVVAFIYYGLSFNTDDLVGDPLVNFSLSGAVEFPAYPIGIVASRYLGRRRPYSGTLIIGGLVCLVTYFLPGDPKWLSVAIAMIGKLCITSSYGIVYVFTPELFPTMVRNTGLGCASFFEEGGSILAPFVHELGIHTQPYVPFVLYGILAVTSGVLVLFLPETYNCSVPDTLEEAVEASRRRKDSNTSKANYDSIMLSHLEVKESGVKVNQSSER